MRTDCLSTPLRDYFLCASIAPMKDYNDRLRQMGEARYLRIKRMRERKPPMTLEEIAALEGCTRQRIGAIIKRGANGR